MRTHGDKLDNFFDRANRIGLIDFPEGRQPHPDAVNQVYKNNWHQWLEKNYTEKEIQEKYESLETYENYLKSIAYYNEKKKKAIEQYNEQVKYEKKLAGIKEVIRKEERKKYTFWIWIERATWFIVIAGAKWEQLSEWISKALCTIRDIFY